MGTREVYEQKLRTGNLYHDPTIKPGLGSPRCPRCLSLLNPICAKGEWTITSILHDATAVAGSGIGGMLSAVHGFNTGIPFLQNRLKGPKWLPFLVGLPPLLAVSAASAAFGVSASEAVTVVGSLKVSFLDLDKYERKFLTVLGHRFTCYVLPKFAQLTVTSYYASSSASHYGISLLTRHIEESYTSRAQQEKLR
ncbi:hypothetical protein POTOM_025935 [Populus tomentosa]|uniref:Gb protein n=1 Tax=Populus tomentosa TaxID=118781 RepID=A0A8X8CXE6_POPTO|nr:hypothetical protein POTOM_025935 [Populus tomentosa]